MLALDDVRVLDFSTLVPGPLASLIFAEAGAEVIKVERPAGEDMRGYPPQLDGVGGGFAMLNRGKRAIAADLRDPVRVEEVLALAGEIDIVLEQFRPGVMNRLGLGYEAWRSRNPKIIYCAITGYGQDGPRAHEVGHDLNYAARTGLLSLVADEQGAPAIPPTLIADIGGGAYPAVINLLLALRRRDRSGQGCFLDIAMSENLFTFMFWGLASGQNTGSWPKPGAEQLTGGSARYRIYRTNDGRHLAVAPLEDKFWQAFCEVAQVPAPLRDDEVDPAATIRAVEALVAAQTAQWWEQALQGRETCCTVVATLEEAVRDLHFTARAMFERQVTLPRHVLTALPVPVAGSLRRPEPVLAAPSVGQDNHALLRRGQ
jgi:alpha-methylacyl-CoA racemase